MSDWGPDHYLKKESIKPQFSGRIQYISIKLAKQKQFVGLSITLPPSREVEVKVEQLEDELRKMPMGGKQKLYLHWDGDVGSYYVGNESGQIVLLSLLRWVKPLPPPRFPRLSDNKWLPTLSLSVFCFLSNKTSQGAGKRETVEQ